MNKRILFIFVLFLFITFSFLFYLLRTKEAKIKVPYRMVEDDPSVYSNINSYILGNDLVIECYSDSKPKIEGLSSDRYRIEDKRIVVYDYKDEYFKLIFSTDSDIYEFGTSDDNTPKIISASVEPSKVVPGDTMIVTAEVEDCYGIESVTADMGGIETIELKLVEGNVYRGIWQRSWLVHSTEEKKYITTITATNVLGKKAAFEVEWEDPSLVGTSTSSYATYFPFQRKSFYANGRFWVFYSDGTNMVYRTSTDGSTWTVATTVRACTEGYMFSVWFDGTYLHYAYASQVAADPILYRRGTPNSDGTITWSALEQTAVAGATGITYYFPFVSVSNGYAWIGYRRYDGTYYYPYVTKSGANDGTWTTASGFPYQLSTTSNNYWYVSIIPLAAGKMLAVYAYDGATVKAKRWDGSAWGTEKTTTSAILFGQYHSAVAQGDDVHIVFLKSTGYDILYVKYTYATDSFGTEVTVKAGATSASAPALNIDSTNKLYCFWATKTTGTPAGATANHIYYQTSTDGGATWSATTDWIDESIEVLYLANRLTCFYKQYDNYIGLEYMTKTASPYNVRFDFLTLPDTTPPTYSLNSTNSTIAGTPIEFRLKWSDETELSKAITSLWNGSSWVNATSWCSLSGTGAWCNQTLVVNSTPQALWWKQYVNDTSNNWNTSENFSLVAYNPYLNDCSVLDQAGATYYLTADTDTYYFIPSSPGLYACMDITADNVILDCQGHLIDGNDTQFTYGVHVDQHNNVTVKNCILSDWYDPIFLRYTNYSTFINNTAHSNMDGLTMYYGCEYNTFINNTEFDERCGFYIRYSNHNTFINNIVYNNEIGFYLENSNNNTIKDNVIRNNTKGTDYRWGIYFYSSGSTPNRIYNNLFNQTNNKRFGGTIYENYWNTTRQTGNRIYSPGAEIGGNYWTNSTGNEFSDTCTDADRDGFCDSYYELNATGPNRDYLPLSDEADTTPPTITWESPTPANATTTSNNWVYLNTTITDASNTSAFFNWNYSLVGFWAMDWYNSTGIYDNSTYNNFGTFNGGLSTSNITTGKYGKALSFDGTDDYVSVPHSTSLNITNAITLEAWVKADNWAPDDYDSPFVTKASGADWGVWNLVHKVNDALTGLTGFRFEIVISGTRYKIWSTTQGQTNQWYHLVGTFDGTTMRLYVNGIEESSSVHSGSINTNSLNLQIGKQFWYGSTYSYFDGLIDEVRIYDRALRPSEINASYNNGLYRLYHNFTSLSDGNYDYYAYAIDTEGNANKTGIRIVTVDTPPTYSLNSTNSTLAGTPVEFRLRWTDNVGLSGYIFSFDNGTGNFANDSWVQFTGTWSNVTKTISSTVGATIRWKVYANDTSDNWNASDTYSFVTTAAIVFINLTSYKVWWNDSVTAYGRAVDQSGSPVANENVNLTISNIRCNNVTDSSGYWSCSFNAPLELGTYTVNARIGSIFINTTSLIVQVKYGETPIGKRDRVVYEQPMLIQEPSGRIRIAWARIMVWRS